MKHLLLIISLLLSLLPDIVWADTHTAASCSLANVQTALNASSAGDTVSVPACGSTNWTGTLVIDKAITLQGTTSCTGAGATLSCTNSTTINGSNITAIRIDANDVRVTGFTLTGGTNGAGIIETTANASGWRIDHCRITATLGGTARGAFSYGVGSGLYDHVYVDTADGGIDVDGANGDNGTYPTCESANISCDGTYSWAHPTTLGDGEAVYVEDSYFNFSEPLDGAYDTYGGARLVFRYNYISGANLGGHGLDSGGERSTLRQELYRNTFVNSASTIYTVWNTRGGMHMLFGNTITGNWGDFAWLQNYRSDSSPEGWGTCTGSNAIDGNTSGQQGYPCRDQVGRGPETTPANDFPQKSGPPYTFSQPLMPGYSWANNFKGSAPTISNFTVTASGSSDTRVQTYHILNNRDFYNEVPGFNGTSGIGTGTKAQMNAITNCTQNVAFWVTDEGSWNQSGSGGQGQLYQCGVSHNWVLYYTPYAYPHPLRGEGTPAVPHTISGCAITGGSIH